MVNKNYKRGYKIENRVFKLLKDNGFFVVRSAGSKGIFDLVAFKGRKVYGIQCKKKFSKKEFSNFLEEVKKINFKFIPIFVSRRNKTLIFFGNIDLKGKFIEIRKEV